MAALSLDQSFHGPDRDYAVTLVRTVCRLARSPSYLDDLRADLRKNGMSLQVGLVGWIAALSCQSPAGGSMRPSARCYPSYPQLGRSMRSAKMPAAKRRKDCAAKEGEPAPDSARIVGKLAATQSGFR